MLDLIEKYAARVFTWALVRQAERRGLNLHTARAVAQREVAAISATIRESECWQMDEQRILTERLGRRYDLGMAMNESANRALEAKKAAKAGADVPRLTAGQEAALKVQQETLERIVRRS